MKPNPKDLLQDARDQAARDGRWSEVKDYEELLQNSAAMEQWESLFSRPGMEVRPDRLQGVGVWLMVGLAILFFLAMYLGAFR